MRSNNDKRRKEPTEYLRNSVKDVMRPYPGLCAPGALQDGTSGCGNSCCRIRDPVEHYTYMLRILTFGTRKRSIANVLPGCYDRQIEKRKKIQEAKDRCIRWEVARELVSIKLGERAFANTFKYVALS